MHLAKECGQHTGQRLTGADIQRWSSYEILAERHVKEWPRSLAHAFVLRIGDHTYDSNPAALHFQSSAYRISTGPIAHHHGSIHDGDPRGVFIVRACEFATGEERYP